MSRYRVVDAVDDLLGTATFRGGVVRQRGGVFTDADGLAPTSALDALAPHQGGLDATCSNYRHGRLRGARRCPGCGRTRNEVAIDDPPGGRP